MHLGTGSLKPSPRFAFHPALPERAGFRQLLRLVHPELARLIDLGDANTLMAARNRTTLYRVAKDCLDHRVPGDFIELGVHRGGSAAVLAGLLTDHPGRRLHLFDRWGDLPEPTEKDGFRGLQYARANIPEKLEALRRDSPLAATRDLMHVLGYDGAVYHDGWYHETLPLYSGGPIAFASVDCDYYESVALALTFVAGQASPGCRIVLDDYDGWPGARAAADEFCVRTGAELSRTGLGPAIIDLRGPSR